MRGLPVPSRERWQPLRGGLLNLYRFDHEVFTYADGRLLLRGNNGTGKSRVLALQLPFLLDGEVAPHRVEPDGDVAKRIEWNLLLGRYPERQGYTWLEFGRLDEAGNPWFCTLGCGLSAVAGHTGLRNKWFFVTDLRVGAGLTLTGSGGQALGRDRLTEALGERGTVYTTAAEYRQAVDDHLFCLGEERYRALVDLLIQLRQPQLSRQLDEARLSRVLGDALPALDPVIVSDVAESFRDLERYRQDLDAYRVSARATESFLEGYRRYARIAGARAADGVRAAHSRYDETQRELRQAVAARGAAATDLARREAELDRIAVELRAAEGAIEALQGSPAMRNAEQLDRLRSQAGDAAKLAQRARDDAERARTEFDARRSAASAAHEAVDEATRVGTLALDGVRRAAAAADAGGIVLESLGEWQGWPPDGTALEAARDRVATDLDRRRRAVERVKALEVVVAKAENALHAAQRTATDREAQLEVARTDHAAAEADRTAAHDQYRDQVGRFLGGLEILSLVDPENLRDRIDRWLETFEGPDPLGPALADARRTVERKASTRRAGVERMVRDHEARRAELDAERRLLEAGADRAPPAPHTRSSDARQNRPGAPLWACCDFRSGVSDTARAGYEAALEAAGLLDGWVSPDGVLRDAPDGDLLLDVASLAPLAGPHLGTVLVPSVAPDTELAEETVAAVLTRLGAGPGPGSCWVASDGTWRNGPARGAWAKPRATYLGHTARERARRDRLAQIVAEQGQLDRALDELRAECARLDARLDAAAREEAARPVADPVLRHEEACRQTAQRVVRQRDAVAEAQAVLEGSRDTWRAAGAERDEVADDCGLVNWIGRLDDLVEGLHRYDRAMLAFWQAVTVQAERRIQAGQALAQCTRAGEEADRAEGHWVERRDAAARFEGELSTQEALVGSAVEEVLARLQDARRRRTHLETTRDHQRGERENALVAHTRAIDRVEDLERRLDQAKRSRGEAIDTLAGFAATGLLPTVDDTLEDADGFDGWPSSRWLDLARRLAARVGDLTRDAAAWDRAGTRVHQRFQELQTVLGAHDLPPTGTTVHDVFVVEVPVQGRRLTLAACHGYLAGEVLERERMLGAREREVIENHLIGEVASHLHQLLHAGREWVERMNTELAGRPMSTGLTLKFEWQPTPDGPPGLVEAHRRLLRMDSTWSLADRDALGRFLQGRIEEVRSEGHGGTWQQQLEQALDYRQWHRFSVLRKQDGQWKRLTRRTHGTGSGGEKVIALTVPQFAAAAAHYHGSPLAPRLIALDEAFVGVDADMRSKCMGLLTAFDLDFVMTSEREWGCYPTLPALAICQLATRRGLDAVAVTRWVWNGQECRRDEPAAAGVPPLQET